MLRRPFLVIVFSFFSFSAVLSTAFSTIASAAEKPSRIVSLNICSDELLLLLAEPDSIASITYLSADPRYSQQSELAKSLHLNHGLAEEIVALEPDLIFTTQFSATAATRLLRSLGHEVTVLGIPNTLEESIIQIRDIAHLIHEEEKGEALVIKMQNSITDSQSKLTAYPDSSALFYSSNGMTYGNYSLQDTFIKSLGWENIASNAGINGVSTLNLETLITHQPDYIFIDSLGQESEYLAHPLLHHPVIEKSMSTKFITLPDSLFSCAGPSFAQAYKLLAESLGQEE